MDYQGRDYLPGGFSVTAPRSAFIAEERGAQTPAGADLAVYLLNAKELFETLEVDFLSACRSGFGANRLALSGHMSTTPINCLMRLADHTQLRLSSSGDTDSPCFSNL